MTLFLQSWWSRTYNRPLKDPLLLSYTFEELLYEFYDKIEREKAAQEATEQETDKIEEAKEQSEQDWAEQEEKRELAELAKQNGSKPDPAKDKDNLKWMEDQLLAQKEILREDFGEDINLSLDE